jgi:hypothetical protein
MKSLFKASILGLGHSEVVLIRQHVATILEGVSVDWVGATYEGLDFLIVNSNFINASSVQNLLRNDSIPVLLTSHSTDQKIDDKHTIKLPLLEVSQLKKWLHECVLIEAVDSVQPKKLQDSVITQVLLDNAKVFEYLSSANDGLLHLSDSCGAVGIMDTTNQLMYTFSQRKVPVDMQGHLTYQRVSNMPNAYPSVDLLPWLWDVVWFAQSCSVLVTPDQLIKLKVWPQPTRESDRRDILLMSAKLAEGVTSAQEMAIALKIPMLRVQHFMSAMVMSGFGERYTDVLQAAAILPHKEVNIEEKTGLRRLLMGVRKRLGL